MKANVTLRDVARHANVHPSTVSRALNPATRGMVTAEVVRRVLEIAERLGYRPNPFAYSLKTNRSFTVGVLVPDIANPLFPPIIRGIESVLDEAGYTAILANSDNQAPRERIILDKMRLRQVDGLILATAHREDALVDECLRQGLPLVLINRTLDAEGVCAIVNDDEQGIRLAVSHLAGQGHTRIAHVAGPQTLSTGHGRYLGFQQVMNDLGLEPHPRRIEFCHGFSVSEGHRALRALLERGERFTAIIAANDLLALGCYDGFAERGLRCPEEVSVTGFNDMPLVDRLSPPLTTVRIPQYEMGAQAARSLLEQLRGVPQGPQPIRLAPELIVRGSTGPAARAASARNNSTP